ncbi:MAG: type II secretion system protein [Acidimicrobiia bacterium]
MTRRRGRGARERGRGERGETLVELLVTVVIMGSAIVALVAGVATAVASSDTHRQDSTAEGVIRSYAERVQAATYTDCATTYAPGYTVPASSGTWTMEITSIRYLQADGSSFASTCPPDLGAQQITLHVVSPHTKNGADETLVIVKRDPRNKP